MTVNRYRVDCYAFYDAARLDVTKCDDGDYVLFEDHAATQARVEILEAALRKIADGRGLIPDASTIYMDGTQPSVPKVFSRNDMQEIARRAMEEE